MHLIAKGTILIWCEHHPDAAEPLKAWAAKARVAKWGCMSDIQNSMPGSPSPVGADRVVFDIHGGNYRLVCAVDFARQKIFAKWFGSHAQYNKIDVKTVEFQRPKPISKPDGKADD